jgi:hypothetical protein
VIHDISAGHTLQSLARALGGDVRNGQIRCPGPNHSPVDRSLSIRLDSAAPDGFICNSFAGDDPIVCKNYVRQKAGLPAFKPNGNAPQLAEHTTKPIDDNTIAAALAAMQAMPTGSRSKIVKTYNYTDAEGALRYQTCRLEPKDFRQRRPNGNSGWIWNLNGVTRVPYRLADLIKYNCGTVFITEGEKDADRLAENDLCATTVASGKWDGIDISIFVGRDVIVLEDNDDTGLKRARDAAEALHGTAATIRIVRLPDLPEKGDVSDWLDANRCNAEKLVEVCFAAPLWQPDKQPNKRPEVADESASKTGKLDAIKLTFFDELTEATPKPWLIKNVITRGETSSWIAPPGKGKSALLTDIAVHLAHGKNWRNYRTKARCGVVYFAIERADLVKRRLVAYRLRDGLPNLPIAVAGQVIDLMDRNCSTSMVAAIQRAEQHFGCEVGLAIIDTYPKGIAAGGGDESHARDQNIVLANLRRVLDKLPIHVAGIGHTGKDESKGERGSNARLADVDVSVQVSGDIVKTATVKKANDQPEGVLTSFRLEPFELGVDDDGDSFLTFILSDEILTGVRADHRLPNKQKLALEALTEAVLSHGQDAPAGYRLPQGIKVVTAEQWKTELFRQNVLDKDAGNPRARYNELRNGLRTRQLIGVRDDWVWRAEP